MKNKIDVISVTTELLEIEKEYNLLNWSVNSVFIWQSLRATVYTNIINCLIPKNIQIDKIPLKQRIKTLIRRIVINSLIKNPFLDFKKADYLVFNSSRKYLVGDQYIDIYTEYLVNYFKENRIKYRRYNITYETDGLGPKNLRDKHLDFIYLISRIISFFYCIKITQKDLSKINFIENEIKLALNYQLDFKRIIIKEIKRYKSQYIFYKLLIKLKKPNEIFLINSTDKAPLIMASKNCKVIVNELQHGLIVKEALICNYPYTEKDSLAYFPNKFYKWKDLDMCTCELPISKDNIVEFSNMHLNRMKQNFKNTPRNKKQILIISQPIYSDTLLDFVLKNVNELADFSIVYKIHPIENKNIIENKVACFNFKVDNMKLVRDEESIYKLFSESEYVIGIYSTSCFEASYFGCKVFLLNMPGVEMAYSLIINGKAELINADDRLLEILQ